MPGALPVINRAAVETTILTGLALGCDDPRLQQVRPQELHLPRPAQGLSDLAVRPAALRRRLARVRGRWPDVRVGITRVHLEEDTARLMHRADARRRRAAWST